jgi:cytochrome b pre-mRNA-processing protein 3
MLDWLRKRRRIARTATELYGSIVAAARRPWFYHTLGVPDTIEGRFAMLAIHVFLVIERLNTAGAGAKPVSRALLEAFVADMDHTMREIGIGDMGVPRRVRKATAALYERTIMYRAAMAAAGDDELFQSVARTAAPGTPSRAFPALVAYMRSVAGVLATRPEPDILAGRFCFPEVQPAA